MCSCSPIIHFVPKKTKGILQTYTVYVSKNTDLFDLGPSFAFYGQLFAFGERQFLYKIK